MDTTLIISIYAASLSTAVALWRVYEFFDDKRGKIEATLSISTQFITYEGGGISDGKTFYGVSIVNKGKHKRIIERPSIKLNKSNSGEKNIVAFDMKSVENFPRPLEVGEKYEYNLQFINLKQQLLEKGASKFRFSVRDTHGRTYWSNWMKL